jgi:RNA polymerase sigma-70 factor (ECF subfamily)
MTDPGRPAPADSTARLLEQHRSGDPAALDRLFARYLKPLERWAHGRLPHGTRDIVDTQDLVQETLIRAFNRIEEFVPDERGGLHAYLRQAVLNRIRDEIRRAPHRPHKLELTEDLADRRRSGLHEAVGSDVVERYEEALGRLRPEEREAIIARIEWGMTYAELAQALGKPTPEAARKAVQRALVRLAEEMERGQRP